MRISRRQRDSRLALDPTRVGARGRKARHRREHFSATGRPFFSEADLRPHKSQYWLTSQDKRDNPEQYQADVENICDTYCDTPQLAAEGTHVMSTDEKTGMQALERLHATKPVRPGLVERVEFEYIRHGTLSLIANFDVVTGKVVSPSIGPTRTEADFVAHINRTIETDPDAGWIFITDQLDTHRAATLVELVARRCGIEDELGTKGESGILSRSRRAGRFWRTRLTGSTRLATARA